MKKNPNHIATQLAMNASRPATRIETVPVDGKAAFVDSMREKGYFVAEERAQGASVTIRFMLSE